MRQRSDDEVIVYCFGSRVGVIGSDKLGQGRPSVWLKLFGLYCERNAMKRILMTVLMSAYVIASARGQGFLNLDFSLAHNLPSSPGIEGLSVSVTNALPDWNAYEGEKVLSSIYYVSNNFSSAYTLVELEGGTLALGGNSFGVGIFSGGSLCQTAQVPGNAESLEFESPSGLSLTVDLGGESLSLSEISANTNYNVYGANLPAGMAGQVESNRPAEPSYAEG